jgi:hypothetical protein
MVKQDYPNEFKPFRKEIEETAKYIQSQPLHYETGRKIGINLLSRIAKKIPHAYDIKILRKHGKEIIFIDRGETYAETIIFQPKLQKGQFKFGSWGSYAE